MVLSSKTARFAQSCTPEMQKLIARQLQVLTVNQTVGILVKYWSCKDWEEAVTSVVPPRKADGKNEQGETKEES